MKKIIALALSLILALAVFAGCAKKNTFKVGASVTPHAEILNFVKDDLAAEGIDLEVVEYTDYVIPNTAVESGELDANFFQHQPYLTDFNAENGTHIVSVAAIHYEPFGIFPGQSTTLDDIKDGAKIAVPNDSSNEARALLLLEAAGIIKLDSNAGISATVLDITENPHNVEIIEIDAAQLARSLPDVDFAAVNGNYAIQAGLNAATDALFVEDKDSIAAETYANILCVKEGNENTAEIKALIKALQSDKVKQFISEKYNGGAVAVF